MSTGPSIPHVSKPTGRLGIVLVVHALAAALVLPACAARRDQLVLIPSPEARYDHNRESRLVQWSYQGEAREEVRLPFLARDAGLASPPPAWMPRGEPMGQDGMPEARLWPLFSGLRLPLAASSERDDAADRSDLLDYLGSDPRAQVGLEPRDTQATPREKTAADYGPILTLLATAGQLSRDGVAGWARERGAESSRRIVDARFPAAAFSDRVAIAWRDYWFILFALPGRTDYTRLIVVPKPPGDAQDWDAKLLGGKE